MNPVLEELLSPAGYEELPEALKIVYTPQEYLWLSDQGKATLVQRETEPEWSD